MSTCSANLWRPFSARIAALWQYKSFVLGMVWREFRRRYIGSLLGNLWSVLNPMAMIFVYTIIFSKIMGAKLVQTDDSMAYGMFLCAGLLTWNFFSELLGRSPNIFIEHANLLKKVSFPRITLPVTLFISTAIDFILIFGIFLVFLLVTGRFPGTVMLAFLPLLLIQQAFALGLGIFLGTLNVFFRDVGHLVGIGLQYWFWFTPIVYPVRILPERIQALLQLNPMTQFITTYQNIILYAQWPDWTKLQFHIIGACLTVAAGYVAFHKLSGEILDEL